MIFCVYESVNAFENNISIYSRFVSSLLESGEGAWIGLNDRHTESDYVWNNDINDDASYFSWADNEPSNTNEKCNIENCVEMKYPNSKWNDMVCNGYNSYVCELKKNINGKIGPFPFQTESSSLQKKSEIF